MARANKNKETAVGSQNRTVSPNEAKSALTHCIKLQRPIMMWGAPGIGKSDIVKQIADTRKRSDRYQTSFMGTNGYQRYSLLQLKRKQHGMGITGRITN